jgi:hypothetical protein
MKFLLNLCYLLVIILPIFIVYLGRLQHKYNGSLSKSIDRLNGYEKQYNKHNLLFTVIWILSIIFIITYS